jgi:hypothetical protein
VGGLRFYLVACDILELGRGEGRRKCVLRLISASVARRGPEAVRPRVIAKKKRERRWKGEGGELTNDSSSPSL